MNACVCVCPLLFHLLENMKLKMVNLGGEGHRRHLYVTPSVLIHVSFDRNERILALGDEIGVKVLPTNSSP